jgi:diguanylate cyclase
MSHLPEALANLLFGPPGRQRQLTFLHFLGLVVFAVFAVLQHGEVLVDLIDADASWHLTWFTLTGGSLFYLLVRSGWNQRLGVDPSLSVPSMLFAMVAVSWSYAITGPARGAVVGIMLLILLFGTFSLSVQQARLLTLLGFMMLGGVMLWKGLTDPQHYDSRVEVVHLVFAGIVMAGAAVLAQRISHLRRRLMEQRADLTSALERIQALATRDALTGLLNRRAMLDSMAKRVRDQARHGKHLSLALIDLDHFKRINDSLGHGAGDRVLQAFARVTEAELRGGDMVARWGGEEFLVMLPDTSPAQARHCIERIRLVLQAMPMEQIPEDLVVTFSAGLSLCRCEADIDAAIERADMALYRAKTGGRNRTEQADVVGELPPAQAAGDGSTTEAA